MKLFETICWVGLACAVGWAASRSAAVLGLLVLLILLTLFVWLIVWLVRIAPWGKR